MDKICKPGSRAVCTRGAPCEGPTYLCDPNKNADCPKTICFSCNPDSRQDEVCRHTTDIQYAADLTPLCSRAHLEDALERGDISQTVFY